MFQYMGATVRGIIAAPPADIWAIISDPTRHPEIAGSGQVVEIEVLTPPPMGLGSQFQAKQNMQGVRYQTVSYVVAFEEERRFTWRIGLPGTGPVAQVWEFTLTPHDDGTLVAHSVALPYAIPQIPPFSLASAATANWEIGTMEPTLSNIAQAVGAPAPANVERIPTPAPTVLEVLPSPLIQGGIWMAAGAALVGALLVRRPQGSTTSNAG